jgi:hypothetical protein
MLSMNKLLALIFIVSFGFFGFSIARFIKPPQQLTQILPILECPGQDIDGALLIRYINQQQFRVRSLTATVHIQATKELTIRLSGQLAYQESKCFRLRTESRFGLELDLGSNADVFWFWSKRMRPPALYYATHDNYLKTPLKAPFDPLWMMRCLNFAPIDNQNIKVRESRGQVVVRSMCVNNLGQLIQEATVIDPLRKLVVGHYLCNEENQVIASAEVKEFQEVGGLVLPSKIKFSWYEERTSMNWDITDVRVNGFVRTDYFRLPSMGHMIDMSRMSEGSQNGKSP